MYKMLALDIDDTLTAIPDAVSPENIAAIKRAQDAGVRVIAATGRGEFAARIICDMAGLSGPAVVFGGARVYDFTTGETLQNTAIDPEYVRELLTVAHEMGIHAQIYQGERQLLFEKRCAYSDGYCAFADFDRVADPDIYKKEWHGVPKVLFIMDAERAPELTSVLKQKFDGKLQIASSNPKFVEANMAGAHKGTGCEWVANYFGIDKSEVVTIGDNTLDAEMISWAGLGAVVGNASDAVKSIAQLVTPSCKDNGVAWLIDNVILKG